MGKRNTIPRMNRKHLLEPKNIVILSLCCVAMWVFNTVGMYDFAIGYYISTLLVVAQVLLTKSKRFIIVPIRILFVDPIFLSGLCVLVFKIVDLF